MPWPCRIVSNTGELEQPGDMCHSENGDWYVMLPNGGVHNIHAKFRDGSGWNVTGEAPNFTVTPSIRCFESRHSDGYLYRKEWHGYLTNGVLTDDLEGRKYDGSK